VIAVSALLLGMALGATLIWGRIGFAGAFRAWQTESRADGLAPLFVFLGAGIVLHALAFGAFEASGGFVAPAGLTVAIGAFVFGIGMQLANACGSGTLAALGAGSTRMLAVLPFFVAGAMLGTLNAEFWDALPALPAISVGEVFGWPAATAAQLAFLAIVWRVVARGAIPDRRATLASLALAAFAVLALPIAGHVWGITWGFALIGAKAAQSLGWDPSGVSFWRQDWAQAALEAPLWTDTTIAMDAGIVIGAIVVARTLGQWGGFARPRAREWIAAAIGGVAMGYGARISGGCNIGAFVGGIVSGSPHGWLWIAAALIGSRAGIALRPYFAMRA
jgi:uncharacterized membrane protein YedE/YeeE